MTSPSLEERALEITAVIMHSIAQSLETKEASGDATQKIHGVIEAAIREAVEAEREACARIADDHYKRRDNAYAEASINIAYDIRSRSEKA